MRRGIVQALVILLLLAGVIAGWLWLGKIGRQRLQGQPRFTLIVANIECPRPPGLSRGAFLEEIRYLSRLPAQLDLLHEDLVPQLRQAFAAHPWVLRVDDVVAASERPVQVKLSFRTPILAVRQGEDLRVVDGQGILLPRSAPSHGLPVYDGQAPPPQGPAGTRWGDVGVEQRARQLDK